MVRVKGITQFYLPPTRLSTNGMSHIDFTSSRRASHHCVGVTLAGWLRGSVVERRSSAGVLSLSCARPVADG